MKPLPLTLEMMKEYGIPVSLVEMNEDNKIEITWERQPEDHEKEAARFCCMYPITIHKF